MATVARDQEGFRGTSRSPLVGLIVAAVVSLPVWALVIVAIFVI